MKSFEIFMIILMTGMLNALCVIIGALIVMAMNNKEIKLPDLNPITKIEEIKEHREEKKGQERDDIIRQNIDKYDGTSNGQKDIPY